jgi:hypothetical protein
LPRVDLAAGKTKLAGNFLGCHASSPLVAIDYG